MLIVGIAPKSIGQRTLTDVEKAAQHGEAITLAQRADLERSGWVFNEYVKVGEVPPVEDPGDGPMLAAVRQDLTEIDLTGPGKRSLGELALWLANTIDRRGGEGGASTAARLAQELRATMTTLTTERTGGDPSLLAGVLAAMSTPDPVVKP